MPDSGRKLNDWINAFMRYTENTEPDPTFRKWTAISAIASVLQRKCYVPWGPSLTFYPNLYIVLVGPSGSRKGTAMNPGLDLLMDLGNITISAQATTLQALIRRLKETNYTDIDFETNETSFHSSLTIFSKEFTVFLGYHNHELMASLCDWYDCDRRWSYETISRQTEEIIGVWVNLFGATTPDLIRSSLPLDAIGGGLTSRIIFVFAPKKGKIVPIPCATQEELALREHLFNDLEKIYMLSGRFNYTQGFIDSWTDWYIKIESDPPPFTTDRLRGYMERRPTHIMKLSMIMSASRSEKPRLCVTTEDFNRAVEVLAEVEQRMPAVFSGVGKSPIAEIVPKIITYLANQRGKEIPIWKISRHFQEDVDEWTLQKCFQTLELSKYITILKRPQADDTVIYHSDIVENDNPTFKI